MEITKIIRSKRKTVSVSIDKEGGIIVRAPLKMPKNEINSFVNKNTEWIENQQRRLKRYLEMYPEPDQELELTLRQKAKSIIPQKVGYFSKAMGLYPNSVKITSAKKRFGSCSSKNCICFSWRLMRYPDEAIDYVVVHELAHIKHKNHGKEFYKLIKSILPDYKNFKNLLK